MSNQWPLILGGLCAVSLFGWLGYSAVAERARRKAEREQAKRTAALAAQTARRRAKRKAAALAESTRIASEKERAREAVEQAGAAALERAQAEQDLANARVRQAEEEAISARLAAERAARATAESMATCAPPPLVSPPTVVVHKPPEQTLILIADDSKLVRYKTGRLLEQHQYQVSLAIDGFDAVRQMRASAPDVVITDVEMPGMDGFELARHIRDNPLTANVPIIMITAAEDKHRESADRAGVSALLGKPYVDADLVGFIRSAMRQDVVH